jgi:hypothetical protein
MKVSDFQLIEDPVYENFSYWVLVTQKFTEFPFFKFIFSVGAGTN